MMNPYIPYTRQYISDQDIEAVVRVLRADFLTQGPEIAAFERDVAVAVGAGYAVALSNATAGLHLACKALGLKAGEVLWTSPITFVASANCARYCGANVDFVDIDPRTYNISVEALEEKLRLAREEKRLPKIVVAVHLAGQSCEMEKIHALSREYGFCVIEDAAHAIGGTYKGVPVGNCVYSDCTVFSFHAAKVMTSGEGGMVVTKNKELADRVRVLATHGITRDGTLLERNDGPWYYEQKELGYHYRLTDIQAALGRSQLLQLPEFLRRRRQLVSQYAELLKDLPVTLPWQHEDTNSSWHLYIIRLHLQNIQKTHLNVFKELRESGIGVNLHYIPVYKQPDYVNTGKYASCPNAEIYYQEAISLPIYYSLTDDQQQYVVDRLKVILGVTAG